jgi:hypothetical protein
MIKVNRVRTILSLLLLGGCAQIDPYTREDMWQPNGANSLNLAAMVVQPSDLIRGHGDPGPQPVLASIAVGRLLLGVPKPLPPVSDDSAPGGGGAGPAAAPPPAGAN